MTTVEKIRAEIEQTADEEQKHDEKWAIGLRYAVKIIDKYEERQKQNDKKCVNCKLIGTDSCYMVCGGSKSLYKPSEDG